MTIGIYKISCNTNQFYWGSSNNLKRRFIEHRSLLKRNKHGCKKLQYLYDIYGLENLKFEIVEECDLIELEEKEKFYLDSDVNKLNLWILPYSPKGCKRINKRIYSEETKRKISNSIKSHHKKNGHPNLGRTMSDETKLKISNANKNRKWSEESKQKILGRKAWNKGLKMVIS